jgi:hypothetical protein
MRVVDQLHKAWMILVLSLCFLVLFAGVRSAAGEEQNELAELVNMKDCEGMTVTQCEVAKNLINTLKMGEDLTCGACFIQLQALGIAPGEDWSYEDPHKEMTQKEMKEVILEVQLAYGNGTVRLDGLEAAAGINDFCKDMKGPVALPAPSEQGSGESAMPAPAPSMKPQDQGSTPAEETEQKENTPASGPPESGMQKETNE